LGGEGIEQLLEVPMAFHATEAPFGIEQAGDTPALPHVSVSPMLDALGDLVGDAEGRLDWVGGRERLAKQLWHT
jgi:hypothetical protein